MGFNFNVSICLKLSPSDLCTPNMRNYRDMLESSQLLFQLNLSKFLGQFHSFSQYNFIVRK